MDDAEKIVGLALAGGKSKRFGAEKAMADFRGRPLIDYSIALFAGFGGVIVSAGPLSQTAAYALERGYGVVEDEPRASEGPLAGICAGLAWAAARGFSLLAVAPCDTPLLPADLYIQLAAAMGDAPACFVASGDGDHPLCALWRVSLLDPLRAELAGGEHPPIRSFLLAQGGRRAPFANAEAFANANTAAELARLIDQ